MAWSRAYIGAGALILVCWQHMLLEKLHHSPFCVSSIMDSDSESTLSSGMHSMPAPTFVPTSVMVLSLTASVYEHTIDIKATSMGATVVAVVQHPKPKSLDMDTLNHMVKKAAVKNGWITVLDGVKLLGKHNRVLSGTTSLWPSEKWKFHWARELVAKRTKLKCKVDPRIVMLSRYIEPDL